MEKFFHVSSFFCGCADLRKGAVIIGSIKLVLAVIQVAYLALLLSVFAYAAGSLTSSLTAHASDLIGAAVAVPLMLTTLVVVTLVLFLLEVIVSVIVNALLIHAAVSSKAGAGYTLPWMIVTMIGIVFGILAIFGGGGGGNLVGYITILDVGLSIYFFIVIKSYRDQLMAGSQAIV